jgi:hypothetical protein
MLAFHVIHSTLQEEYDDIQQREKTPQRAKTGLDLGITAVPYEVAIKSRSDRPLWDALVGLASALVKEPRGRGKLVELRDLLATEGAGQEAKSCWRRYRDVLKVRNEPALAAMDHVLKTGFRIDDPMDLPLANFGGTAC